jgi:hypothetical protein
MSPADFSCYCYLCSQHPNLGACLLRKPSVVKIASYLSKGMRDEAALADGQWLQLLKASFSHDPSSLSCQNTD